MLLSLDFPMSALLVVVYVVLAPGVVFSFPRKGSIVVKALVHGILFAVVSYLLHSYVLTSVLNTENFVPNPLISEQALHSEQPLYSDQALSSDQAQKLKPVQKIKVKNFTTF